jgi:hypothetical protein
MPHRITKSETQTAKREQAAGEHNQHGRAQRYFLVLPHFYWLKYSSANASLHISL